MRLTLLTFLLPTLALAHQTPLPAFQRAGPLIGVAEPIPAPPYTVRWQYKAHSKDGDRASVAFNTTIAGGLALVADTTSKLHTHDLITREPKWTYITEGAFGTPPLVLINKISLGNLDGLLHCIEFSTGQKTR